MEQQLNSTIVKSFAVAAVCHVLLLLLLPVVPKFTIPDQEANIRLNVFLPQPKEEELKQTLLQPFKESLEQNLADHQTQSIDNPKEGEDEEVERQRLAKQGSSDTRKLDPKDTSKSKRSTANVIMSYSSIKRFAEMLAREHAETHKEEVVDFARNFEFFPSEERNSEVVGFQNRFGDVYVRDSRSDGDICYTQQAQINPDTEFGFNIVQFYQCGRQPKKF